MSWFKKLFKKDEKNLSDFPTKEQRIESTKGRIVRLKMRLRKLKSENNPNKAAELQTELDLQKNNLRKLEN